MNQPDEIGSAVTESDDHSDAIETGSLQYLEDFAVGQRYGTGVVVVEAGAIKAFAAAFDPQPFHLNEAAAEESIFGRLVASGWHTMALTMRLLVESQLRPAWGLIGLGADEVRWPRPVEPGDRLQVESEVLELHHSTSKPDRGTVRLRMITRNQRDEIVLVWTTVILVARRSSHGLVSDA